MKIKEIELTGFKSFDERTVISFHNGITAIVGPNGCGKSNVVDAFRWVLGEQSAKSLRGEKMDEVIFQGSDTKKQRGMADVTLLISGLFSEKSNNPFLENEDRNPDDNKHQEDKIIVSRRLYRSGESEYLLNKKQCRLKDIKDIFLDTGLDVKGYSILDHSKISEILNTKPLERRFLIEEIAGVMKYKVRKAEAMSKLESSKENLQRINDILYEIKRQINSLDRQVKRAERYKKLSEDVKFVDLRMSKRDYIKLTDILNNLMLKVDNLSQNETLKRVESSELENKIEIKRIHISEKEKYLSEVERNFYEKERLFNELEKSIVILKNNIENTKGKIEYLNGQQQDLLVQKDALNKELLEIGQTEDVFNLSIVDISEELRLKREQTKDIESAISEKESKIENKRKEIFDVSEELSAQKNELHKYQSDLETLNYKEASSNKEVEDLKIEVFDLERNITKVENILNIKNSEMNSLQEQIQSLQNSASDLNQDIENQRGILLKEKELFAGNVSRLNSLKELGENKLLLDVIAEEKMIDFIGKSLSDTINVDKDFEIAIESALADKIDAIVLEKIEDIISIVEFIKTRQIGRTTFFYSQGSINLPYFPIAQSEKIIGRAGDFVETEGIKDKELINGILNDVYIVKDIATALELHKEISGAIFATLDGEIVTTRGFVMAGRGKEVLKRKREIKELQKDADERQVRIKDLEITVGEFVDKLNQQREDIKNYELSVIEMEKQISIHKISLINQKEDLKRRFSQISFLSSELSIIGQDKERLVDIIALKEQEIIASEQKNVLINQEILWLQDSVNNDKTQYETERSQIEEIRLAIATYRGKMESIKRQIENINKIILDIESKYESTNKNIEDAQKNIEDSITELEERETNLKLIVEEISQFKIDILKNKKIIFTERQYLLEQEGLLKQIRQNIDTVIQDLSGQKASLAEYKVRVENIEVLMEQKYGLKISSEDIALEGFDSGTDEENLNQLNEKIKELGPVNLGTLEEYGELKERYDFLSKQQQDLTSSIVELEEAISRINSTTKRKLSEAYESLKTKFNEVFKILFNGGKANLILTDKDNILESGLEIIAQPPGKKLQNLNLLSGGERALTSLALLFAGFLLKPSPLCILDEVDAPLDDSNTIRFIEMIKNLAKETQFLVITHNKTTMESADYIYGITMEEPGVSKTISLQFSDVVTL